MIRTVRFGGLLLQLGPGVIEPRPWTVAQSRWLAADADRRPEGPILDLYSGCGPIGLEAARRCGRDVVHVEASEEACRWAAGNATRNGLGHRVEIRNASVAEALEPDERFPLILADPPYVPTAEVARFPEDPVLAIDGGPSGLDRFDEVLDAIATHLAPGGVALVQTRGPDQARTVERRAAQRERPLRSAGCRLLSTERAIVALEA